MGQQEKEQMRQDHQNQGNDNQRQEAYESFAAEQDEQLNTQNKQSPSLYEDEDMLPPGMGGQWAAEGDETSEYE